MYEGTRGPISLWRVLNLFSYMQQQQLAAAAVMSKAGDCSSSKIFRPWDVVRDDDLVVEQQDSTISTTSELEAADDEESDSTSSVIKQDNTVEDKSSVSETQSKISLLTNADRPNFMPSFANLHDFPPIFFPACTNLNDPFLLESLSQHGYAFEDYARVLSQEHQAKLLNSRKQRPKKYRCPHCSVGFSNNGQLKGHIRIHTGERPFKCEEKNCGKTFTRNEELTRHKRIHSGLRPFPCAQCGKRFGRKDHLKKHSRTHLQSRGGLYAVPVVLPLNTWTAAMSGMATYPSPYGHHPFVY